MAGEIMLAKVILQATRRQTQSLRPTPLTELPLQILASGTPLTAGVTMQHKAIFNLFPLRTLAL